MLAVPGQLERFITSEEATCLRQVTKFFYGLFVLNVVTMGLNLLVLGFRRPLQFGPQRNK